MHYNTRPAELNNGGGLQKTKRKRRCPCDRLRSTRAQQLLGGRGHPATVPHSPATRDTCHRPPAAREEERTGPCALRPQSPCSGPRSSMLRGAYPPGVKNDHTIHASGQHASTRCLRWAQKNTRKLLTILTLIRIACVFMKKGLGYTLRGDLCCSTYEKTWLFRGAFLLLPVRSSSFLFVPAETSNVRI